MSLTASGEAPRDRSHSGHVSRSYGSHRAKAAREAPGSLSSRGKLPTYRSSSAAGVVICSSGFKSSIQARCPCSVLAGRPFTAVTSAPETARGTSGSLYARAARSTAPCAAANRVGPASAYNPSSNWARAVTTRPPERARCAVLRDPHRPPRRAGRHRAHAWKRLERQPRREATRSPPAEEIVCDSRPADRTPRSYPARDRGILAREIEKCQDGPGLIPRVMNGGALA